ncbi:MAG TPA: ABC-type transport auxiliary lipoprotein family protein [Bryobacteraceae bacterium]|nr:ABC-type transport auxiliary lipoprotein family protein [Bryobacteraceae bacterium]
MMRSTGSLFLAIAACFADAGCIATKPVHYYTLGPGAPATTESKPGGLILLVGNISTPEALQDGRIRYRTGPNEVGAYEYHRWMEQPGTMVRNALIRALRNSGQYQRVLESGSSVSGDYLLRGNIEEFDEVDGASIRTKISLHVELVELKTNRNVWDQVLEREEPVNGKTVVEVVQSLDRNLQHVVSDTTSEVDRFLTSRVDDATKKKSQCKLLHGATRRG